MTRALPRTHLNSSRLTRFLTENAMVNAAPVADDVGQKLGDWLNFRQAIALHGVLNPEQPSAAPQPAHLRRTGVMTAEALTRYADKVRGQLSQSSPRLQQLAALDAAFENILSEREAVLLGKVSKLHEKRFAQALKQHLKKHAEASNTGAPATPGPAMSAWLLPQRQAMRTALLAELDTRLQPVLGLLEAFHTDTPQEGPGPSRQ